MESKVERIRSLVKKRNARYLQFKKGQEEAPHTKLIWFLKGHWSTYNCIIQFTEIACRRFIVKYKFYFIYFYFLK